MSTKEAQKISLLSGIKGKLVIAFIVAVVIFSCAATMFAFANIPKEVTILDGNESVSLQTNLDSPKEIIAKQGIELGKNDVLDDSQFNKENSVLIIKREMTVSFIDASGKEWKVTLPARTVADVLAYLGIELGDGDAVSPHTFSVISDGEQITLYKAGSAKLIADGKVIEVATSNKTVREVLRENGIALGEDDYTVPELNTVAEDGGKIELVRVSYEEQTEQKALKPKTVYKSDDSIPLGMTQLSKKGRDGQRLVKYRIRYENGKPVVKEEVASKTLIKAQDQVVLKGSAKFGTGKKDLKEKDLQFSKKYTGIASAYYEPKGNHCANGMEVAVGRIGVDPSVIPYGTKLYVTGYGYCIAADTGPGVTGMGRFVDLYMNSEAECEQWGLREVNVYVLK